MSAKKHGGCGCGGSTTAMVRSGGSSVAGAKSGCGCGAGKSCGCGGSTCSTCNSDGYVRPLFFGGQLLTEDDLQALVDYVVDKNRLHNRMLFGAGVVCGLEVTCDPCDCANVVVQPGYALDCCGNDIVVPCPVTLDVNQLVRELKARIVGKDCGEPCPPGHKETTPRLGESSDDEKNEKKKAPRRYCLYVKYCEQPVEPVAPYATDDCSPTGCQASRIQEGFTFELRCDDGEHTRHDLYQRLEDCFGKDRRRIVERAEEANLVDAIFAPMVPALTVALAHPTAEAPATETLAQAERTLRETLEKLPKTPTVGELEPAARQLMALATVEARSFLASHEKRSAARHDATHTLARDLAERLPASLPDSFAARVVRETVEYFKEDALTALAKRDPIALRALAEGTPIIPGVLQAAKAPVQRMYEYLLRDAEKPSLTVCQIERQLASYSPPGFGLAEGAIDYEQLLVSAKKVRWLATSTIKVLQECVCSAFLPPCNDCDDDAVLLACLTVCDCCVDDICNLERDVVLTGPNVRYWVPGIDRLFARVEECCCPEACDDDEALRRRNRCLEELIEGLGLERDARARLALGRFGGVRAAMGMTAAETPSTRDEEMATLRRDLAELRTMYETLAQSHHELKAAAQKASKK